MRLKINKKLFLIKFHFFLFNAGCAPLIPFLPVIVRQLGFSAAIVGTIYTILPITGLIAKPLFGVLADRFQKHKFLFVLFQLLLTVFYFSIVFVPDIPQNSPVNFQCNNGTSFQKCLKKDERSFDSCIIDQIQISQSTTLKCQLNCNIQPWMWDTIDNKTNNLEFTTVVESLAVLENCLDFKIKTVVFSNGSNSSLYCLNSKDTNKSYDTKCEAVCNNQFVTEMLTVTKIPNNQVTGLYQFWILFFLLVFSRMFLNVLVGLTDTICFELLGDDHHLYGNQRLWGAVGWGILAVVSGIVVDKYSEGLAKKDYTIVFYIMLSFMLFDFFVSNRLQYTQTKLSKNILKDVGKVFSSLKIVIFFLWCILIGMGTAVIWNFLFWHLETLASEQEGCNHMSTMKTLQGLVMGIQCFGGELPFFFLSGKILKKIGHVNAMSLVLLGFGVRFLLYSILINPWWVLPIELLNGVTFGIFYTTMTSYASIIAPSGTEATFQGLVGASFESIGSASGSFIAGILFERIGGSATFRFYGIIALVLFITHVIAQKLINKSEDTSQKYITPTDALQRLKQQEEEALSKTEK